MSRWNFFGLLFYLAWIFQLTNAQIPKTSFSCEGRSSGYYADVGTGCQAYHMCDGLGRKFSFTCPNATLFQQRMLICDHWFMVNCSKSESLYGANLLIGQKGKPFVDDSGQASFQRTPRPDYAMGLAEKFDSISQNKVDVFYDLKQVKGGLESRRHGTQNNLPTRSTEHNQVAQTAEHRDESSGRQDEPTTNSPAEDRLNHLNPSPVQNSANTKISNNPVNFESRFKATTPVYPNFVEESLKLNDLDLAPPKIQSGVRIEDINNLQSTDISGDNGRVDDGAFRVNFESNFKATTPVYPNFVDDALKLKNLELSPPIRENNEFGNRNLDPVEVNFQSNFKATTPVYPTFVEEKLKLNNLELYPPLSQQKVEEIGGNSNTRDFVVNFPSTFKATTPVYPPSVDDSLKIKNFESPQLPLNENQDQINVNFESSFKATTPVYPQSVEATSPIPDRVGLLPPLGETLKHREQLEETTTRLPVNFESNFLATIPNYPLSVEATSPYPDLVGLLPPERNDPSGRVLNFEPKDVSQDAPIKDEENAYPSQYYEPPLYSVGYVDPNGALVSYRPQSQHIVSPKVDDWNELKKRYSVPDFEFPLDSNAKRSSYESDLSSFQPRAAGILKR